MASSQQRDDTIEVRLVFEQDLMRLEGFWRHTELPSAKMIRMRRDQTGKDVADAVFAFMGGGRISSAQHLAFFVMHTRKTRQVRFKSLLPQLPLLAHIPQRQSPSCSPADPHLVVLCVASRGYDPYTFQQAEVLEHGPPHGIAHGIGRCNFSDDFALLIVKYFCTAKQKLVTLGTYYSHIQDGLCVMMENGWLKDRLQLFVDRKIVAPLPDESDLACWEEYHNLPSDILRREISASQEKEGLYTGDVVIFQLAESDSEAEVIDCEDSHDIVKIRNVKDYLKQIAMIPQPTQTTSCETLEACWDSGIANAIRNCKSLLEVQKRKRKRESPLIAGFGGPIMRIHERGMRTSEIAQILAIAEDDVVAVLVSSEVAKEGTESSAHASQATEGDPDADAALVQRLQSDPQHFQCPLLYCLMGDPVIAEDGHTYEREAISEALKRRRKSPMTNIAIGLNLVPNRSLKSQIDGYKEQMVSEIIAVVPRLSSRNDAAALLARVEEFVKARLPERSAQKELFKLLLLTVQMIGAQSPDVVRKLVQHLQGNVEDIDDWERVLICLENIGLAGLLPRMKEDVVEKLLHVATEHKRSAKVIGTIGHELIQRHMTRVRVECDRQDVTPLRHLCYLMVRLNKIDSSKWFEGTAAVISIFFQKIVQERGSFDVQDELRALQSLHFSHCGCQNPDTSFAKDPENCPMCALLRWALEFISDHEGREAALAKLSLSPLC